MAVALIVAAGRGERLGFGRPKALVSLAGRPMLEWSVCALRSVPEVERIVIALPEESLDTAPVGCVAVAGGSARSESVLAALRAAGDGDPVIVHDAARPLAPPDLFVRVCEAVSEPGVDAAIAAAPVSDTIKEVGADGVTVKQTLDRSRLWAVQTPQAFRRAVLERVLGSASPEDLASATDDAWLVERAGGVVRVVTSSPGNLKVTTPADVHVAELRLGERRLGA